MDLCESLDRVLKQQALVTEQFYSLFLDRYPEVRRHFAGVHMRRQALMLTVALMAVERHATASFPVAEMYLHYLGTKHHNWAIPPEAFPKFRDALLETLGRFHGKEWDADLAAQWARAIDRATETMLQGYQRRFNV
jgi:hemoglobin-like flavoprotein